MVTQRTQESTPNPNLWKKWLLANICWAGSYIGLTIGALITELFWGTPITVMLVCVLLFRSLMQLLFVLRLLRFHGGNVRQWVTAWLSCFVMAIVAEMLFAARKMLPHPIWDSRTLLMIALYSATGTTVSVGGRYVYLRYIVRKQRQ